MNTFSGQAHLFVLRNSILSIHEWITLTYLKIQPKGPRLPLENWTPSVNRAKINFDGSVQVETSADVNALSNVAALHFLENTERETSRNPGVDAIPIVP